MTIKIPKLNFKTWRKQTAQQLTALPKWTKIGVIGAVLMYAATAGMASAALPWWIGKGDSALHIDYALSVYHGDIPRYHDFVQYPVFHQLDKGYKTQIQRAAANPPLFYILHAPIVGPLLDSGHWKKAIALGRAFNVFLGALVVLSLAWAGWLFGGKRKELFAVAVPAVGGMIYQFIDLNHNYALDVLLILMALLTTITWQKLLKHGFEKRYLIALFILSILGMATKATYIVFLGLSLLTIMIVAFIHGKDSRFKKFLNGSLIAAALSILVMICIGWFYYFWNYKTSGKWFDAVLPGDFRSRQYKTLSVVITDSSLWTNFYKRLTASETLSEVITAASLVGIAVAAARSKLSRLIKDKKLVVSLILLALVLVGTTMTQIAHAIGVGQFGFRYFLPAILVFSLFVTYGLLEIKRARGQLVSLAVMAMAITSINTTARLKDIRTLVPAVSSTHGSLGKLNIALSHNGFPVVVLILLLVLLGVGIIATASSLFMLSGPTKKSAR